MKLMEEQPAPTPALLPQKPNSWVWIGVCVVMLAVGIGIGLFLAKNIYPPLQILPTPTPSPTVSADPTANWKTYTNNSLNYSIKIPSDWDVNDDRYPDKGYVVIKPNNTKDYLLVISSQKNKVNSLNELLSLAGEPPRDQHKFTFNGYEAILTTDTIVYQGDTLPTTTNHYYLINNNDGHSIHEVTSNEKYYPILSQILSTFTFVDQNVDPEGKFCGGFAGIICPKGYECKYDGDYPDASGICIKN